MNISIDDFLLLMPYFKLYGGAAGAPLKGGIYVSTQHHG